MSTKIYIFLIGAALLSCSSIQAQQKNAASAKGTKPGEVGIKIITRQEPAQGARNMSL